MHVPLYRQLGAKIDLKHLLCAVAAADHGSFRRAADSLNMRQSTLSRSIDQLEHATSTKLFERRSGGIIVSAPGTDFIRMARAVLDQINEFGPSTMLTRKQLLRVGFCTSLSIGGLRSALLDFQHRHTQFGLSMQYIGRIYVPKTF
jgi:DNA-binding transcriptional LysR family regulator